MINAANDELIIIKMPYPLSPFAEDFDLNLIDVVENDSSHSSSKSISNFTEIFSWLCRTPLVTSIRVNTLLYSVADILNMLKSIDFRVSKLQHSVDEYMSDVLLTYFISQDVKVISNKEIIIDTDCGAAVLRGAHVFAPGVLGMSSGCRKGDQVSIYVDLAKKCKKGLQKIYNEHKVFIGNGIVVMVRSELYVENISPRGIAVEVTETISGCPQISEELFPKGSVLLQNVPSIVCVHTLDPTPGEIILDMCASPGHKTSHIAALMQNKGTLVAIDKTPRKIEKLMEHCSKFNAQAHIFLSDSTNIFEKTSTNKPEDGPPFPAECFDKILLDAPCSALGKRPQFRNDISKKVLRSYVPLQKKLFKSAMSLLKPKGTLVYSTCTITLAENEGIVAWALKGFDNLKLVKSKVQLGEPGLEGTTLNEENLKLLQRFGPNCEIDSIGFFIASFVKT